MTVVYLLVTEPVDERFGKNFVDDQGIGNSGEHCSLHASSLLGRMRHEKDIAV